MHHRATHLRAEAGAIGSGGIGVGVGSSSGGGAGASASSGSSSVGGGSGGVGGGSSNGFGSSSPLPSPAAPGQYRYAPLASSAAAAAATAEGPALSSSNHHRRSLAGAAGRAWDRLRWALVHHRYPLLGALALLVLALLFLGPVAQQAMSAPPPWKQTLGSMMGLCKQKEQFQRIGRALWVAGDAFPKRFGCDPSHCHCIFLLAPERRREETAAAKHSKLRPTNRRAQHAVASSEEEGGGREGAEGGDRRTRIGEEAGVAGLSSGMGMSLSSSSFYLGGLRRQNFFQQDKPLCLVPEMRYEDLVQEYRLDAARTKQLSKGPSLFYTSDIVNPYHIMHFRARPIFDFMVRRGLEAGQAHFFEPKPKDEMPGGYGAFLMQLLGEQLWKDDFKDGSSVLFEELWVRPRGRWLFPPHQYYPETHDPRLSQGPVMYGPHVDPKWNQLARFVRRKVLGQGEEEGRKEVDDAHPYILLVDRVKSRRLLDARTGSFDEVLRVLREEGGLRNLEAVRFEEITELEQFRKVMKARIMVAVHGAALTNMAFQPPYDSSVVEIIFSPRKPDYPNMARTVGRGYHYVWAERAEERYDDNPVNYRRVYVDSRKLLAAIKEAMAKRKGGVPGSLCC